jgi:hypothetical protein
MPGAGLLIGGGGGVCSIGVQQKKKIVLSLQGVYKKYSTRVIVIKYQVSLPLSAIHTNTPILSLSPVHTLLSKLLLHLGMVGIMCRSVVGLRESRAGIWDACDSLEGYLVTVTNVQKKKHMSGIEPEASIEPKFLHAT